MTASLIAGTAHAGPIGVSAYLIIATGDSRGNNNVGDALNMQDSEIGAISAESGALRFNAVSPRQGNPAFPAGTRGPATGIITLDGDATVTSLSGQAKLSNSDVHAVNTGPANVGSQGIDCANSFSGCNTGISSGALGVAGSGSGFNQTGLPGGPSFSQVAENNGYQGSIAQDGLLTALGDLWDDYWDLSATQTFDHDGLEQRHGDIQLWSV